jgi:hypothetical protein
MKIHELSNISIESGKYLGKKDGEKINKCGKTLNKKWLIMSIFLSSL